ncbi:hypothetical protein AB0J74_12470 [Asanoa sp. NPDC049573]|uniref:hypothetical protein n=1 Tax=Asanoa sp. NPDC049573 TaxID=3155396 RepID=UPI0034446310
MPPAVRAQPGPPGSGVRRNKTRKLDYLLPDVRAVGGVPYATALIELARNGEIPKDSHVLYAHLGGQPALDAPCRPSVEQ